MKKFLKILLIVILVAASIGGTAFLFYKNLHKDVDYFSELTTFSTSKENQQFLDDLKTVGSTGGSERFGLIYSTNVKLDECLQALSGYLILEKEYNFKDKSIKTELSNLNSAKSFASYAMDEYFAKIQAGAQDPARADDVYKAFANYFISYSKFLNKLNSELSKFNLNKETDLKFSLIELYSDVCISSFSNMNNAELMVEIENKNNINLMNQILQFDHSFIKTNSSEGDFSYLNTEFIHAYNNCNKTSFAENLKALVDEVNDTLQDGYSNNQLAAFWLKKIFGV